MGSKMPEGLLVECAYSQGQQIEDVLSTQGTGHGIAKPFHFSRQGKDLNDIRTSCSSKGIGH